MDGSSPLLTDEEACQYLRIRQRQLYAWRMAGIIPFIRIGRSIRYRIQDLDAAIEAIKAEIGAESVKDMGKVMAVLKERHASSLDMSKASALVKAALS